MLKVIKRVAEGVKDGKLHAVCQISVKETSELVTETSDTVFTDGSIAWCITTGAFYGLSGGTWYNQDGSGETV